MVSNAIRAGHLLEKTPGSSSVTVLRQHEIKSLSVAIDGTVEVGPLSPDLYVSLVHALRNGCRPLPCLRIFSDLRRILHHPAVQGGIVHFKAAFLHISSKLQYETA